jgi:hypothetical protein
MPRWIAQMHPYVIFHHFPHEAVDRASGGRNELQYVAAANFLLQGALDCFNLPSNAPHAVEKLNFLSSGFGHGKLQR